MVPQILILKVRPEMWGSEQVGTDGKIDLLQ